MKITILTDNPNSWIMPFIEELKIYLKNDMKFNMFLIANRLSRGIFYLFFRVKN